MFYCANTDPADSVQRLSPENKEVSPYIPLQAGYRCKKQSSTHLWLHVTSLASAMWPSCFNSLSFISLLCHLCLFLFWPSSLLQLHCYYKHNFFSKPEWIGSKLNNLDNTLFCFQIFLVFLYFLISPTTFAFLVSKLLNSFLSESCFHTTLIRFLP
jgi:hypothetical protein